MKKCSRCKEEKSLAEFGRSKTYADGYDAYCKECRQGYNQKYRQEHRQYYKEYQRKYSQAKKVSCPQCGKLMSHTSFLCIECSNRANGKRLAECGKNWWANDPDGKKQKAASERSKKRWQDEEYRQEMESRLRQWSKERTGQKMGEEFCQKVSDGLKRAYAEGRLTRYEETEESRHRRSETVKKLWEEGHYDHVREANSLKLKRWARERAAPKIAARTLANVALSLLFSKTKEECRFCELDKWPYELGKRDGLCKECRHKLRDGKKRLLAKGQKRCSKCLQVRPLSDFAQCKRNSDGKNSQCKTCTNKYTKQRRGQKPEEQAEISVPSGTKICGKCGSEKSYSEFYKDSHREDGYRWQCKDCVRAYEQTETRKRGRHENYLKYKERNQCPDCGVPISPWAHSNQRCPKCAGRRAGEKYQAEVSLKDYGHIPQYPPKRTHTDIELELSTALDKLGLKHIHHYSPEGCRFRFDEYLPDLNIIIEADGEYYHHSKWAEKRGIPARDAKKDKWVADNGYKIIRLRGRDIREFGSVACLTSHLFTQLEI